MARAALVSPADTTTRHSQSWVLWTILGAIWTAFGAMDGLGCQNIMVFIAIDALWCYGLPWVPRMVLGAMEVLGCHVLGVIDCPGCHGWSWVPWTVLGAMDALGCHILSWVPQMILSAMGYHECHELCWVPWMVLCAMDAL